MKFLKKTFVIFIFDQSLVGVGPYLNHEEQILQTTLIYCSALRFSDLQKLKFRVHLCNFLHLFIKKSKFNTGFENMENFWGQIFQSTGDVAEIHFMSICSKYVFVGMQKQCSVSRTPPLAHSCVHSLKYTQYKYILIY